jgi:anti-sigma regulatory factor (Ser/Thr protein kinase)
MGGEKMKESFSITPRVIAHLGEDLIKNESIALLELVKNSYDADATKCHIQFIFDENNDLSRIIIEDNGTGMDMKTIKNVYLVIGTDNKKDELSRKLGNKEFKGRYPLGEKGIGRLGVHKLGNKIELISKTKESPEIVLNIDWEKLLMAKKIDDFKIDITERKQPQYFDGHEDKNIGTIITIENLKTKWDRRQLRTIHRNLNSLHSPFSKGSDEFSVKIDSNRDIFAGLPKFKDIKNSALYFGHCVMKEKKIVNFSYNFKPWASLDKMSNGRSVSIKDLNNTDLNLIGIRDAEKNNSANNTYEINLEESGVGTIEFDLIIFEKDAQIFNYVNAEKTSVNTYLRENGGIRVYRENVRIYDYGEPDNDWLGIDLKRVHRVGGNVSNNIILGSVRLNRSESFGLKEKTNREGFIEDDSYRSFVDAVNFALSIFVRERNIDKDRLTTLYKKHKVIEPVLSDLDEVIQIVDKKVSVHEDKDEILKYLYRINTQYKDVKEVLIKSANAGLNLSVVIHEIEKQVVTLVGLAERGETKKIISVAKRLEKIVRGYTAMIRKSVITNASLNELIEKAIDNYQFRFFDHNIKVIKNFDGSNIKAKCSEAETVAMITNLLDNAIFWLTYSKKENPCISIYATNQFNNRSTIIISDNGPGFNIPAEVAIKPFVSGKPSNMGMGLGLHIVNEMMHAMKGELEFLDQNEIDFPIAIKQNNITKAIIVLNFPKGV